MVHGSKREYRWGAATRAELAELEDVRAINNVCHSQPSQPLDESITESVIATGCEDSGLSVQGVVAGCEESIARKASISYDCD